MAAISPSWDYCIEDIRLSYNPSLDPVHLEEDTTISNSGIDRISSIADLVLDHCKLSGQVSAKNLFLDNCTFSSTFEKAEATGGLWVKFEPSSEGQVSIPLLVAKLGVHYLLPPKIKCAVYSNVCCATLTIPREIETVILYNSHISSEIVFIDTDPAKKNTVILKGKTYFRGAKVTGGSLLDEREKI